MFIGGRGIVMDYPCGKFGDFSFSRFGFILRTTHRQTRHTDADDRVTHTTAASVSKQGF